MEKDYANHLLNKVCSDYNAIAEDFSNKRRRIWPGVKRFRRYVSRGDRMLDMGCGNGRLRILFRGKGVEYVGVDPSEKLVETARRDKEFRVENQRFEKASGLDLPFEKDSFDSVFSIAVLHHIPSREYRIRFLEEARRVLKPDGVLILTVWYLFRRRFLKYHLKHLFLKVLGRTRLDWRDIFYPWKGAEGRVMARRYIHCFTRRELLRLTKEAGFEIRRSGFLGEKKNLYVVAEPL